MKEVVSILYDTLVRMCKSLSVGTCVYGYLEQFRLQFPPRKLFFQFHSGRINEFLNWSMTIIMKILKIFMHFNCHSIMWAGIDMRLRL